MLEVFLGLIWIRAQTKDLSGIHIWGLGIMSLCLLCGGLKVIILLSRLYQAADIIKMWRMRGRRKYLPKVTQLWSFRATELWFTLLSYQFNIIFTISCWHKWNNQWHFKYLAINCSGPRVQQHFPHKWLETLKEIRPQL